jgi:hypothetical protein
MSHTWRFFRAGGFDQVRIENGADVANLAELDQKLWVALACPVKGLEFDGKTLELIDTDRDGRIRAPDIVAAAKWTCALLKNPDDLAKGSPELPLDAINDATPEGAQLRASAAQILSNLGKADRGTITVEDTTDTAKIFAQTKFNGDGIVPSDSATDGATRAVLDDIVACIGAEKDRSGAPGISQAAADRFFAEAQAFSDWWKKAEADASAVLPLKQATGAALSALNALRHKVDDYFTRCRLAAFDTRAAAALNPEDKHYAAFASKDITLASADIVSLPLAHVEAGKALTLATGVNPAWAAALATLQTDAVKPLLGDKAALCEADWAALCAKLAPHQAWLAAKAGAAVEKLGVARVREILAGKSKDAIAALIAKDKALEPEANAIAAVDRLVRYHRDLLKLLNNFVAFRDFYSRRDKAVFQAGTLYLDQRSCDLCIAIDDAGKHAIMAGLAGTYLAYCECVRKATGEKMQIVAAFTDGDSDNLMLGRNGVFYDRKGRDWDATVTKIIDNPISVRQAFWSPYKKFVRMIEEQIAKRAAAAEAQSTEKLQAAAAAVASADKNVVAPAPGKKVDVGTVAALGVGLGAIGTFLATVLTEFVKLPTWQIPLIIVGIILLISGPSTLIAWLKLRKRNLGPILDANGWAVNARAKISVLFGGSLTHVAKLPHGAKRDLRDPYAEKRSAWPTIIVIAIVLWIAYSLLDHKGLIHEWTKGWVGKPAPVETASEPDKPPADAKAPAK